MVDVFNHDHLSVSDFWADSILQTSERQFAGIDTYDVLSVSFDFHVIGSWDGNGRGEFGQYGPDTFAFTMNGQTLLNETFNNQYSGTEYPASNTEDPIATNTSVIS